MDNKIYVDDISTYINDILEMEYNIKSCDWAMGFDPDNGAYVKTSNVILHTDQMDYQPLIDTDALSGYDVLGNSPTYLVNAFFEHLMQPAPEDDYVDPDSLDKDVDDESYETYQDHSGNVIVVVIKDEF